MRKCPLNSSVFSLVLKVDMDFAERTEFGRSFHDWQQTQEKCLATDLIPCRDGSTRYLSLAEQNSREGMHLWIKE